MAPHKRWLVASAVLAIAVYAFLWTGYALQWNWLSDLDSTALRLSYRRGEDRPDWLLAWDVFCTVLGPGAFRLFTVVLIIVALVRRHVRIAVFLVVSVELAGLVTEAAKAAADRPRPDTAFVSALGTAFPSGHALGVMVAVLALLTVALPVTSPALRRWLIPLGVVVVVSIGVGRVVLNVHHPSDVLAGWALGYAYFVFCLLIVPPWKTVTEADETPAVPDTAR